MKNKPAAQPWMPAPYDDADVIAMRALFAGKASEGQQKRALNWIINRVCGTYDLSYRSDSDRDTVFAEGKRFAGMQIIKLGQQVIPKPLK